jgi:hypothetical protein
MKKLLFILVFLLLINFVSSAPPITTVQQISDGYFIEDTPQNILKQNQDFMYNFFILNLTNGALKTNDSVSCIFYISNSSGNVILFTSVQYNPNGYWGINIDKGNFTNTGIYSYGTRCNSSSLAGVSIGSWEVTTNGRPEPNEFVIVLFIIAFVLSSALVCFMALYCIGHLLNLDFDLIDFSLNLGIYIAIIAIYYTSTYYLGNEFIQDWFLLLIKIGGVLLVLIPVIALIISLIYGTFTKGPEGLKKLRIRKWKI